MPPSGIVLTTDSEIYIWKQINADEPTKLTSSLRWERRKPYEIFQRTIDFGRRFLRTRVNQSKLFDETFHQFSWIALTRMKFDFPFQESRKAAMWFDIIAPLSFYLRDIFSKELENETFCSFGAFFSGYTTVPFSLSRLERRKIYKLWRYEIL